jgi:uncharacterized caspase-like protein
MAYLDAAQGKGGMTMEATAPPALGSNVYALVIGLGAYQDPSIPPLKHARDDARSFAELLHEKHGMRLSDDQLLLLLDSKATLTEVKCAITGWLFERATQDSTVLIFFAGHGHVEPDRSGRRDTCEYLLLWDTRPDNLFSTALSNEDFERCLSTVRAGRLAVFMDACHSGGVARTGSRDVRTVHDPRRWLTPGEGRVIITAAKASQQSWEDASLGHGIFTYHLLEALRGKADRNEDGQVSITEVYSYLERKVPESARNLKHVVQEPFFYGELGGDIILTVDSERIEALAAKSAEEERRRTAELQGWHQKLFELYSMQQLPLDAYRRAMELLEKPAEQRAPLEQSRHELLMLLVKGQLSAEHYLKFSYLIPESELRSTTGIGFGDFTERNERLGLERVTAGSRGGEPTPPPVQARPRFCMGCGRPLQSTFRFCTGCGRPVPT